MPKINCRLILFIAFVLILIACSCFAAVWYFIIYPSSIVRGNGNITSEKRNLSKFSKINVTDKIKVNITQTNTDSVLTISAEDNLIKQINTEVRGDTLFISFGKQTILNLTAIEPSKDVVVNLTYQDLVEINISGSVTFKTENRARLDKLILLQSKSSTVDADIFANSLIVDMAGDGTVQLKGSASKQEVKVSGFGKYLAKDLDTKETKLDLSGSGKAEVRADESLEVNVSGSGSVEYSGNPKKYTQNISSNGTVKQITE